MRTLVVILPLLLGFVYPAGAQQINAIASQNFCRVEVVTCNQSNVDGCPRVYQGAMTAGQRVTSFTGHLCYKRENRPGDCNSGLENNWNCFTRSISGAEDDEIH